MKKAAVIIFIIFTRYSILFGQKQVYLGTEIKFFAHNFFSRKDDLRPGYHTASRHRGINISYQLNNTFGIETGFIYHTYTNTFGNLFAGVADSLLPYDWGFDGRLHGTFSLNTFLIPLRLSYQYPLYKQQLFFTSTIGGSMVISKSIYYSGNSPSVPIYLQNGNSGEFKFSSRVNPIAPLIQAGVGLEFKFWKDRLVSGIRCNYYAGFKQLAEIKVEKWINHQLLNTNSYFTKGGFASAEFVLKYKIH